MSDTDLHEPAPATEDGEPPAKPRLPGVAYPLIAVVFGGILVWSFSRILLAVGKDEAVAIATLAALNILIGSALVAYGRRVRGRPVALPFVAAAGLAVVVAGVVAMAAFGDRAPESKQEAGGPKPQAVALTASGIKFLETKLVFEAGVPEKMTFDNKDAGTPHNFVLFAGSDASGPPLFEGEVVTGPVVATYAFTAPAKPGSYFFHCAIHPTVMTGTAEVVPGPPPGGPGGPSAPGPGGPGALQLAAKNVAFSPTKLTASAAQVTIHFDNQDAATPHNVAVFNGPDANSPSIFHGDLVTGPAGVDYSFSLPGPGTYFFHCDVHPTQMTGTITLAG